MANPSERDRGYIARAESMGWGDLESLWQQIKEGNTPEWDAGKALEHLVVRGFSLCSAEAEYPYDVPPGGKPLEQIDGLVHHLSNTFLIECKDKDVVDIEAIAKLRNQLLRRPDTTFGVYFRRIVLVTQLWFWRTFRSPTEYYFGQGWTLNNA